MMALIPPVRHVNQPTAGMYGTMVYAVSVKTQGDQNKAANALSTLSLVFVRPWSNQFGQTLDVITTKDSNDLGDGQQDASGNNLKLAAITSTMRFNQIQNSLMGVPTSHLACQ